MNEIEIAWLAGFLEGEGSFSICHDKRNGKNNHTGITVSGCSTDEDVLRKASVLMENAPVYCRTRKGSLGKKPCWTTVISGHRAVRVMRLILPFMGQRRTKRIYEIISLWENRPHAKRREFGLPPHCHPERKHCSGGLCRSCYEKKPSNRSKKRDSRRLWRARKKAAHHIDNYVALVSAMQDQ